MWVSRRVRCTVSEDCILIENAIEVCVPVIQYKHINNINRNYSFTVIKFNVSTNTAILSITKVVDNIMKSVRLTSVSLTYSCIRAYYWSTGNILNPQPPPHQISSPTSPSSSIAYPISLFSRGRGFRAMSGKHDITPRYLTSLINHLKFLTIHLYITH